MLWDALGRSRTLWDALERFGTLWNALGRSGTLWDALGRSGMAQTAPRWPKTAPREPKIAPGTPKTASRWPQDGPREPKIAPRRLKITPGSPKMAPRWPRLPLSWACLGPVLGHLRTLWSHSNLSLAIRAVSRACLETSWPRARRPWSSASAPSPASDPKT